MAAVVRDAAALGWPVTIHAGYGARPLAEPMAALVEAAPGARIVLAHAGRVTRGRWRPGWRTGPASC